MFKSFLCCISNQTFAEDDSPLATATSGLMSQSHSHPEAEALPSQLEPASAAFVITHIRAHDVARGLGRIPVGFCVVVQSDCRKWKTSNKPVLVERDIVEWDEEIILPPETSSRIHLTVCASFEFVPMLGNGETLRIIEVGVGELFSSSESATPFTFCDDGETLSPCSSLLVKVERRRLDGSATISHQIDNSDWVHDGTLAELTDRGHSYLCQYNEHDRAEDLASALDHFERALQLCPLDHPCRAAVLFNLARAKFTACSADVAPTELDEPISLFREALTLRGSGHPDRIATLLNLARVLAVRLKKGRNICDADEAKGLATQVQGLCPIDSLERGYADFVLEACAALEDETNNQAEEATTPSSDNEAADLDLGHQWMIASAVLYERSQRSGDIADLNQLISLLDEAVRLTPDDHSSKPWLLIMFGSTSLQRFLRLGDIEDLNKSVELTGSAVELTPEGHPNRVQALSAHGSSLSTRFQRLGNQADLRESVTVAEAALQASPRGHPSRPAVLSILGGSLFLRFQQLNSIEDLDRSVSVLDEAVKIVPKDHPDRARWLSNSGDYLLARFKRRGNLADLDRAVTVKEEGVEATPKDHSDRSGRLSKLGSALLARFQQFDTIPDLDKSITVMVEAVQNTPDDEPDKPAWVDNLGVALLTRFERCGNITDLDQSIANIEEALRVTTDNHTSKLHRLSNLGNSFRTRFEYLGDPADLDRSVKKLDEAMKLVPADHSDRPGVLSALGAALYRRFEHHERFTDLEDSVRVAEAAVQLAPKEHPEKARWLNILGNSLLMQFKKHGAIEDLHRAVSVLEEAVQATPDHHPDLPGRLNNSGMSLLTRFERLRELEDLNKSISTVERAVRITPADHLDCSTWLTNLGFCFVQRFEHQSDHSALHTAIQHFSHAASSSIGISYVRFRASTYWIQCARQLGDKSLLDAYALAIGLLPQLAWLGFPLKDRYRWLQSCTDLARDAASTAVTLGHLAKAVEWLEQGRSVVWGQLFQLRTPVDELRFVHSDLAERLERLSNQLEHASSAHDKSTFLFSEGQHYLEESLEKQARRHRALTVEREKLLEEIRSKPGFKRFLLPETFTQLRACAHSGPVVLVNASALGCDALAVKSDSNQPVHIRLSEIDYEHAKYLQDSLMDKIRAKDGRVVDSESGENGIAPRGARRLRPDFNYILSELWIKVVKPVLDGIGYSTTTEKLPRIFWCPTGPFAFLPIHAAGIYSSPEPGNNLLEFAISSYTPTLGVLGLPSQLDLSSRKLRLLAVPQPSSDGQNRLQYVPEEIDNISKVIGRLSSSRVTLLKSNGIVDEVLKEMKDSDWVHFACHGVQDPVNPINSGLCLADRQRLTLSKIIDLSRPRGGLAFLSACETATGDTELSEEAVHLSAGMLFAGYGGVIGTMWFVGDSIASRLAKDVYEQLVKEGVHPDYREAARALHDAVQRLRRAKVPAIAWIPFIHMGL